MVFEETDVANTELFCSCGTFDLSIYCDGAWLGVFADSEKVVEGDDDEVGGGCDNGIGRVGVCVVDMSDEGCWDCKLWDGRWVISPEAFELLLDGSNVCSLALEGGTTLSTQFDGRGDCCQRCTNGLNSDFILVTVRACPDPCSIASEDDGLVDGCFALEEWVCFTFCTIRAPVHPVFLPSRGSLMSDSIGNCSPRKHEITRQANFFGT